MFYDKIFVMFFLIYACKADNQIICDPTNTTHLNYFWNIYKNEHNKTYSEYLEKKRYRVWLNNCRLIYFHNIEASKGLQSYFLNPNHLADLTQKNYLREMVRLTKSRHRKITDKELVSVIHHDPIKIPQEIDWRKKGFNTPVYNQKSCGSCYAFSISHVLEGQMFKATNQLVPLSVQQIVDCSIKMGNYGCGGGSLRNTLKYLEKVGGLESEIIYPYTAKQSKCTFSPRQKVVNISSWAILPARDELALKVAVATIGPVAVSVNASPQTFQLYHSGVYDDIRCTSNLVNHAMLLVGYTKDEWILKNWWGEHWGEKGYMRIKRHKNQCGIANYAAYAIIF